MTAPDPRAHPEIDDATIQRMADELVAGKRHPTADRLFMKRGAPPPSIQWSPVAEALPLEAHRLVLSLWRDAGGGDPFPPVTAIDPFQLKPVLGNVLILEVLNGGADFRFRLYGSTLAAEVRFDWTGATVQEMRRVLKGPGPALYLAAYRAMLRRHEPLYTVNTAMVVFQNRSWARLALPYGDAAADRIERILVANYVIGDDFVSEDEERRLARLREDMRSDRRSGA